MAKEKQLWFAQPYRVGYFALKKIHGASHESKGITSAKNIRWDCYACYKPNHFTGYASLCESEVKPIRLGEMLPNFDLFNNAILDHPANYL
ncbi:TPA: hypothetical protein JBB30_01060 [Legionella pneumophila subsp. pneumophila]|nr:hypothetical protein [Legionella pneumophila]HAT9084908.1 hypothetical protein [Legionella pneumophila subsp. pneumophila]HAU9911352.1 hypothetical protein [Legionella pneumophila]HAV1167772.1 hypothetical protein [Legionella pneumophila]